MNFEEKAALKAVRAQKKGIKIGLIVEGGGMKCAYSAGVLDAFLDAGLIFDYAVGVSAGSANLASFLAGQRERNLRFYTEHLSDPEYFGWKSYVKEGDLFNLHYIYGALSNSDGKDPLDFQTLMASPTEYEMVATHAETGRAVYFRKEDLVQDDYRIFMASSALPAACQPVEIDGEYYYDGGVADSIPVRRALLRGCDRIVAVMSKTHDYIKEPETQSIRAAYTLMCSRYPSIVQALNRRHEQYMQSQHFLYRMEEMGRALIFTPESDMGITTTGMNAEINRRMYDMGLADARRRAEELEAFIRVQAAAS